jgi:hypothetical protein
VGHLQVTCQKRNFVKWFLNEQLQNTAAQESCTATGLTKIMQKTQSPLTFCADFVKSEHFLTSSNEQNDIISFETLALENASKFFKQELQAVGDLAAADLVCKVMVNRFSTDFKDLAASQAKLVEFLNQTHSENGEEESSLPSAYANFKKALQSAPVSTSVLDTGAIYEVVPGDEESEERSKLYNQIIARRRETIIFYHLPIGIGDIYRKGGPLTQILQASKFIESKGTAGTSNSLLLMSADLFPNKASLDLDSFIGFSKRAYMKAEIFVKNETVSFEKLSN